MAMRLLEAGLVINQDRCKAGVAWVIDSVVTGGLPPSSLFFFTRKAKAPIKRAERQPVERAGLRAFL